jgi:hypothetical protein
MNTRTPAVLFAVATLLSLPLAACGGGSAHPTPPATEKGATHGYSPSSSELAAPSDTSPPSLPASSDELSGLNSLQNQSYQLDGLQRRLKVACMETRGFTVHPLDLTSDANDGKNLQLTSLLAGPRESPTPQGAAADGYGISKAPATDQTDEPADSFSHLSAVQQDKYNQVLYGSTGPVSASGGADATAASDDSCSSEVASKTDATGALRQGEAVLNSISGASEVLSNTPAVRDAYDSWSACLVDAGEPGFADPADAYRYATYYYTPTGDRPEGVVPTGGPWTRTQARSLEISLASLDAKCAQETSLNSIVDTAWTAQLKTLLETNAAQIFAWQGAMSAEIDHESKLLSK